MPLSRADAFDDGQGEGSSTQDQVGTTNGGRRRWDDEELLGFSKDGAVSKNKKPDSVRKAPSIPAQPDTNWMEERRRRLGLNRLHEQFGSLSSMRRDGQQSSSKGPTLDRIGDTEEKSGLEIQNRPKEPTDQSRESTPPMSRADDSPKSTAVEEPQDEDSEARAALLMGNSSKSIDAARTITALSEDEALRRDADSRPDAPTLADYSKMPVEEFGAALLRGMGWREGTGAGKQRQGPISAPSVQRRAALLGLGAKERPSHPEEKHRSNKPDRRYVPITRRESERRSTSPAGSQDHRSHRRGRHDDHSKDEQHYGSRYRDERGGSRYEEHYRDRENSSRSLQRSRGGGEDYHRHRNDHSERSHKYDRYSRDSSRSHR